MEWSLVVDGLAGPRARVGIRPQGMVVGRSSDCQIRCKNSKISKLHCVLVLRHERAFIRDLGSRNGTYLNGRKIEMEAELADGDRVRVGPLQFTVRSQEELPQLPVSEPDEEAVAAALLGAEEPAPHAPRQTSRVPRSRNSGLARMETADWQVGCPICTAPGEWVPPTRMLGDQAVSVYRCPSGHTWQRYFG